jgi:hypothetical protein
MTIQTFIFHPVEFPLLMQHFVLSVKRRQNQNNNQNKTPNSGYLGSRNDEERSEMRYAVRIAEFSESSEL